MSERRAAILMVDLELLAQILRLPEGIQIRDMVVRPSFNPRHGRAAVFIEGPSLKPVASGRPVPRLDARYSGSVTAPVFEGFIEHKEASECPTCGLECPACRVKAVRRVDDAFADPAVEAAFVAVDDSCGDQDAET